VTASDEALEAIRRLKARYFRLLDQKRWDEWSELFTDDVVVDTSDDGVADPTIGRDAFVSQVSSVLDGVRSVHHGHMPEIEMQGAADATGVWAMEDHLFWSAEAGGMRMWGTGWYEESYRLGDDGQWRIASMTLRRNRVEINGSQVFPR
jgi:hypothetical protein